MPADYHEPFSAASPKLITLKHKRCHSPAVPLCQFLHPQVISPMELTLMPLGHTDGMLDFVSLEGEIAELKGATIEAFKAVRFEMSAVHGVDVILLKLKHSISLHHIYLDCFGLAHWYEGDESGILESIDESATVTHVPLDFPWNSPLRAVTITPGNAQIASIHFLFETGAKIIFNYESANPNLGTQLKFVMQNEEKEMEE